MSEAFSANEASEGQIIFVAIRDFPVFVLTLPINSFAQFPFDLPPMFVVTAIM